MIALLPQSWRRGVGWEVLGMCWGCVPGYELGCVPGYELGCGTGVWTGEWAGAWAGKWAGAAEALSVAAF